jgi:hypothetical protein
MSAPYLSLVACSRNDDHGGRAWERMTASLDCTFRQLETHGIDSEYVLVDWNPPPARPALAEALPWPTGLRHVTIRVITVPPEIHRRYPLHALWNLFTPLALNVGLRRARGEFAVLSMIDHLYPDQLMAFLAARALRRDRSYRFPRADVSPGVLDVPGAPARLEYCRRNVVRVAGLPRHPLVRRLVPWFLDSCGDFQLLPLDVWHRLRGYRERDLMPQHVDSFVHCAVQAMGLREEVRRDLPVYHIAHDGGWIGRAAEETLGSLRLFRGYVPPPATAEDHRRSRLYRRLLLETKPLDRRGLVPYYLWTFLALARGWRAHDFNGEDWGLGAERLPETTVTRAEWDR